MSYNPVALGCAALRRERKTFFHFARKDLTGLGLSTNVIQLSYVLSGMDVKIASVSATPTLPRIQDSLETACLF